MGGSHCGWTNKNEEKRGLSLTIDTEKGKASITIYSNDHAKLFYFLGILKLIIGSTDADSCFC